MDLTSGPPRERREARYCGAESDEGSLLARLTADERERSHEESSEGSVERDLTGLMADVPKDYVWSPISELDL